MFKNMFEELFFMLVRAEKKVNDRIEEKRKQIEAMEKELRQLEEAYIEIKKEYDEEQNIEYMNKLVLLEAKIDELKRIINKKKKRLVFN